MELNTSSLILQKLEDDVLVRILSLSKLLRPNDLFWMDRFQHRYKIELGKYAKMSYYDIYRDLINAEKGRYGEYLMVGAYRFSDEKRFGKKGWFHKRIVERGYTPWIDQLIVDNTFAFNKHIDVGYFPSNGHIRKSAYIGPLISASEFGHLELVERFCSQLSKAEKAEDHAFSVGLGASREDFYYIKYYAIQKAIKHGFTRVHDHKEMVQYLLDYDTIIPSYLTGTTYISTEVSKILHKSIKYNRYESFEYIMKVCILKTGTQFSRTIQEVPKIDHVDFISWITERMVRYNCFDFLERFISHYNIELSIKHLIQPLIKYGRTKDVSLEFLLYLLDLLPKDYLQSMVDDIIDHMNPTSSRPFLSLFRSFGGNVDIYHYLLTQYSKLPYYFLHKIVRYNCGNREVLEMIFELYPELHLQYLELIDDYKGCYRKQSKSSILPLIELLVEHNPLIDLKRKRGWLMTQALIHNDVKLFEYLIEKGSDIDDKYINSLLYRCNKDMKECIKRLL